MKNSTLALAIAAAVALYLLRNRATTQTSEEPRVKITDPFGGTIYSIAPGDKMISPNDPVQSPI